MDWQVLDHHADPYAPQRRARRLHVQVRGAERSLCGVASEYDSEWFNLGDVHPEDVDPLDRCSVCYSVYERRAREERGLDPVRSNYLLGGRSR